jgi:hypothetical protein
MKPKDVPDEFDDLDCPTPCRECGEWFELWTGKAHPIYRSITICKECYKELLEKELKDEEE